MERVLLYGGSFDPIHHGHLIVARAAAEQLGSPVVTLVPAARPPHKPDAVLAEVEDRLAMCRLAVEREPGFEVSDWEARQTGPSFTLHTLAHFRQALGPGAWLGWLIGMDSLLELHTWHRVAELVELGVVVTAARPGFAPDLSRLAQVISPEALERVRRHILPTPEVAISASEIRARRRAGCSVRFLTPDPVVEFIVGRGLYSGERRMGA